MYDSARALYELLVRRLTSSEREQLWQEYLLFGELFGMPRDSAPQTPAALDRWWAQQRTSERIFLTPQARAVGRSIGLKLPVPDWARPAMLGANLLLLGSLPQWVRAEYGLGWSRADALAFRTLARATRAGQTLMPPAVRRGSTMPFYSLVAKRERINLHAGKRSFVA
jgi:uncharacterized protein (DUF2236 family)